MSDYRCGRFEISTQRRLLLCDGMPVVLGSRAFDLLVTLLEGCGRILLKRELLDRVWPECSVEENNLAVHISALRKVLGKQAISTVPGRGYQFTAPVERLLPGGEVAPPNTNQPVPVAPAATAVAAGTPDADKASPSTAVARVTADLRHGALADARTGNGPVAPPRTSIGREQELACLAETMAQHRLVSLVGPPGIGKSHLAALAIERAGQVGTRWPAAWVDLALTDKEPADATTQSAPPALAACVARSLRIVREPADGPAAEAACLEALASALRERAQWIVLDDANADANAGTVAALVAVLLDRCPAIRFLVISQVPLGLTAATVLPLGPLALPPPGASVAEAAACSAIAMFVREARAVHPAFELTAGNLPHVIALCTALGGVPLALELAAVRLPVMAMDKVSGRFEASVALLCGESLASISRQRAQQKALEHEHAMLTAEEQAVFRRLSVFEGGFTEEMAAAVTGGGARDDDTCSALASLQASGLLVCLASRGARGPEGRPAPRRYQLNRMAQDFAMRLLTEAGELDWARRAHLEVVIEALADAPRDFKLLGSDAWNARYGAEAANLHVAIQYGLHAAPDRALAAYANGRLLLWLEGRHRALRELLETLQARQPQALGLDACDPVHADLQLLRRRPPRGDPSAAR